ncbi:hypothetical protein GJ496_005380 [Pomphorhynchus laevis]|nr:hypothetical protein GJ496_005380 [Pomphorhynchus laevis]
MVDIYQIMTINIQRILNGLILASVSMILTYLIFIGIHNQGGIGGWLIFSSSFIYFLLLTLSFYAYYIFNLWCACGKTNMRPEKISLLRNILCIALGAVHLLTIGFMCDFWNIMSIVRRVLNWVLLRRNNKLMHAIQKNVKCCGLNSYLDWWYFAPPANDWLDVPIPFSCCRDGNPCYITRNRSIRQTERFIYTVGCLNSLSLLLKRIYDIFFGILFAYTAFVFILLGGIIKSRGFHTTELFTNGGIHKFDGYDRSDKKEISELKQHWYAYDANFTGSSTQKSKLFVHKQNLQQADEMFYTTGIRITNEGIRVLRLTICTLNFIRYQVMSGVHPWQKLVDNISSARNIDDNSAYSGLVFGAQSK